MVRVILYNNKYDYVKKELVWMYINSGYVVALAE